jgi:hypothetical protein
MSIIEAEKVVTAPSLPAPVPTRSYRVGDRLLAVGPDGTRFETRVEHVHAVDGQVEVTAAVRAPRRFRGNVLSLRLDAEGRSPYVV